VPVLDSEEYIEQAYFFHAFRERVMDDLPAQDVLARVGEEILSTTRLPMAISFLNSEMKLSGLMGPALARLGHYFTPFQTFVVTKAEEDVSRFSMDQALLILEREAKYRAGTPTAAGLFVYQFEALSRNRLGYGRGLDAIADDPFYALPAGWSLKSLIAEVDFNAAQSILEGKMEWARQIMSELLYYQVREVANESGVAIRYKLAGALKRAEEARGNAEGAIIRANMMALTMAANSGVVAGDVTFSALGTYEEGSFDHAFTQREIMPQSESETDLNLQVKLQNAQSMRDLGYPEERIMEYLGEDELEEPEQMPALGSAEANGLMDRVSGNGAGSAAAATNGGTGGTDAPADDAPS